MIKLFNAEFIITTPTNIAFLSFIVGAESEAAARDEAYATFYDTEYLNDMSGEITELKLTLTAQ